MFLLFCASAFVFTAREERDVERGAEDLESICGPVCFCFCFGEVGAWGLRCSI